MSADLTPRQDHVCVWQPESVPPILPTCLPLLTWLNPTAPSPPPFHLQPFYYGQLPDMPPENTTATNTSTTAGPMEMVPVSGTTAGEPGRRAAAGALRRLLQAAWVKVRLQSACMHGRPATATAVEEKCMPAAHLQHLPGPAAICSYKLAPLVFQPCSRPPASHPPCSCAGGTLPHRPHHHRSCGGHCANCSTGRASHSHLHRPSCCGFCG